MEENMRVRVLKGFATANAAYSAGQVVDIDPRKAEGWLKAGLIMEDKSLNGAKETKKQDQSESSKKKETSPEEEIELFNSIEEEEPE